MAERRSLADRFWAKVQKGDGCWGWAGSKHQDGYGRIRLGDKVLRAHRVSWEFHYGHIRSGLCVLHACDTPSCTNPAHLFLGTHHDNMKDMADKGRSQRGERNRHAKLTGSDVLEIREMSKAGATVRRIGKRHGVTRSVIGRILSGHLWGHV